MLMLVRHLLAVAALPATVAVLIPIWIGRNAHTVARLGAGASELGLQIAGVVGGAIGVALFASSLARFVTVGQGTLAPWDPPKRIVVRGPYRYVRNPMISGVLFVLAGEALVLLSWPHARWFLVFLVLNLTYIPAVEEPMLEQRFGEPYREYRRHVRRFLPRLRPFTGA